MWTVFFQQLQKYFQLFPNTLKETSYPYVYNKGWALWQIQELVKNEEFWDQRIFWVYSQKLGIDTVKP